ncbi:MAG: hypothetical protein OXD31_18950 [Chloroflexi bacterium]|nr:hypothetical protein [Chloroflexota bacterium]
MTTEGVTAEQLYKQIYNEGYTAGKVAALQDISTLLDERRAYDLQMLGAPSDYAYDVKDVEVVKAASTMFKKVDALYDILIAAHTAIQDIANYDETEELW